MISMSLESVAQRSGTTAGLGLNQALFSDLSNHPKYKTIFPLRQITKSVLVADGGSTFVHYL